MLRGFRFQKTGASVLATLTLAVGAHDAFAAFPGANGKVAFENNGAGNYDIYVVNADGTGLTPLASNPAHDRNPAWSPDGTTIAFTSRRNGNFDLYVMNADGSGLRQVTQDPADEIQPAWSPGGDRLVYSKKDPVFLTYDIWVVATDGSGAMAVAGDPANDTHPSWSPDGDSIAFVSDRSGEDEIWAAAVGSNGFLSAATNLSNMPDASDTAPAWKPDGTAIVFASTRGDGASRMWVMDADGANPREWPGTVDGDTEPAWSPDGTAVAFSRQYGNGAIEIQSVDDDGLDLRLLTDNDKRNSGADWQPTAEPPPPPPENRPPVAEAGTGGEIACAGPEGATVRLDGSGSSDEDSTPGTQDDIVAFEWFEDFGGSGEAALGTGETLDVLLAPGSHAITLRVTDNAGESSTDTVAWTVVDPDPPSIAVSLSPAVLWPANHRMVAVHADVRVTGGLCSPAPAFVLRSVTSSEPDDAQGGGDGHTRSDVQGATPGSPDLDFMVRAERMGGGSGRVYTATYAIVGGPADGTEASATVRVPHDRGDEGTNPPSSGTKNRLGKARGKSGRPIVE